MSKKSKKLIDNLTAAPELQSLLPPTTADEDKALKEAIQKDGVIHPLVADEHGSIIDGYRTHRICTELKVKDLWVVTLYGLTAEEKRHKRLALNVNRRHLTRKQQRVLIEQELLRNPAISAGRLGRLFGVSHNTAQAVKKDMVENGHIEVCPVEASDGRVFKASGVLAPLTRLRGVQKKLEDPAGHVATGKILNESDFGRKQAGHQRQALADAGETLPQEEACRIHACRFQDLLRTEPDLKGKATLIVTDPPWIEGFLPELDDLARVAEEVLAPGGILACYIGQRYLDKAMVALGKNLTYVWTVTLHHQGCGTEARRGRLFVYNKCRTVLVFVKGTEPTLMDSTIVDCKPGGGRDKSFHDWQQSLPEVKYFIETFSTSGDLVVDVCGGSFTTAVAAKELGRKFVGCDSDQHAVNIGRARIGQVVLPVMAA